MSDVGGTAGLILGMSFATIVGLIDIFIQYAVRIILLPLEKTQAFIKTLDWDFQIYSKTGCRFKASDTQKYPELRETLTICSRHRAYISSNSEETSSFSD